MNIIFLLVGIIILCIYINNNTIENYTNQSIPAIIIMRHAEEETIGPSGSFKDYPYPTSSPTSKLQLASERATLSHTKLFGIDSVKTLYERLSSKLEGKYKPIDTIITIDPNSTGNPTSNPFLTAYYYVYGESGDNTYTADNKSIINKTPVKNMILFNSKDPSYGADGFKNPAILPEKLKAHINGTKNSVLVIGTRDTLWCAKGGLVDKPESGRLLDVYQKSFNTGVPTYPLKAETVNIFYNDNGTGKLDAFKLNSCS